MGQAIIKSFSNGDIDIEWIGRDAERSEELESLRSEDSDHFKHYLCMCDYFCRVIL